MNSIKHVKTAVIKDIGKAGVVLRDLPVLKSHELLIKIAACNICTSEYGVFNGTRKNRKLPLIFGHEYSGTVIRSGHDVSRFKEGDHVSAGYVFDPYSVAGLSGQSGAYAPNTYKNQLTYDGYFSGTSLPGCAEYTVVNETALHAMNKTLSGSEAAFLEPLGTVCNGIKKLGIQPGQTIAVIGAGTMGILNALVARIWGADVIISEVIDKKIDVANAYGFNTVNPMKGNPGDRIRSITKEKGADSVIIAVGSSSAYDQAVSMLKQTFGKILVFAAGYPAPKWNLDPNTIHYRRMSIYGTYCADFQDFEEAARLLNDNEINVSPIIEERIELNDIQKAFKKSCRKDSYRISVIC